MQGGVVDLDAVVISLTRTSQRLIEFRDRFIGSPLVINHLEGVDGACLNLQVLLQQGVIDASVLRWPRGQVGCALSHLRAIHGVVARNRPLLILEDDAQPAPDWYNQLHQLLTIAPPQWDLLLLGWNLDSCLQLEWAPGQTFTSLFQPRFSPQSSLESALDHVDQRQWFRLHKGLGLAGYLVSPVGASKILDWALPLRTLPIQAQELPERPCFSFDGQLNSLYPKLQAWAAFPPLILGINDKSNSETAC